MEIIVCNYYNLYGVLVNNFNFTLLQIQIEYLKENKPLLVCLYLF